VDLESVRTQFPGRRITARRAIRAYVRGGFRTGLVLNPLFLEGMVSAQLPDADRVPALYAYLVADATLIDTTAAWSAADYARAHPESLTAPGGPLGHAWRFLIAGGALQARTGMRLSLSDARRAVADAARPHDAREGGGPADHDVISLSLGARDSDGRILSVLGAVMNRTEGRPLGAVIDVGAARRDLRVAARILATTDPFVRLTDGAVTEAPGDGVLIRRDADVDIDAAALISLRDRADDGPVAPLMLASDGTVAAAGVVAHDEAGFPLLDGFPAEDARGLGDAVDSATLPSAVYARRSGDARPPRIFLGVTAMAAERPQAPLALPGAPDSPLPALGRGLAFDGWAARGPAIVRTRTEIELGDGETVPRLRWGIKTSSPAGRSGESWGDTHFARALARALERLGQFAAVDARPAARRDSSAYDDVTLVLRGPHRIEPPSSGTRMLWIISHPDEIGPEEVMEFDRVFAASRPWAAGASERFGRLIEPLLQCTDAERFRPSGASRDGSLVFVGTARGLHRPAVVEPIAAGVPLQVYGPDWRGYIPASHIAATGIANEDLPLRYETAGAVLNDHWPAMRQHGFISNRPYDVLAAGGRVISDEVDGIQREFQGAVPTFRDGAHLVEMLRGDLDSLFPSADEQARIGALIRERDSFDARARALLDAVISAR
jgi:hypothetical protein